MTKASVTAGVMCLATGLLMGGAGPASAALQTLQVANEVCSTAAKKAESDGGVPRNLLTSIALAESGRWDEKQRASYAWPWTVTTGGPTAYYPSKEEAVAAVQALQAKGVTNIDVGCMQVNLHYHPHAFDSLNDAFDPDTNVGYASRFLKGLQKETDSWAEATGRYHSADPQKGGSYRDRVLGLWEKVSGRQSADLGRIETIPPSATPSDIKTVEMTYIQERLRARLAAEHAAPKNGVATARFEKWREDRMGFMTPRVTAGAERVAAIKNAQQQKLGAAKPSFEEKRAQQLEQWRQNRVAFLSPQAAAIQASATRLAAKTALPATTTPIATPTPTPAAPSSIGKAVATAASAAGAIVKPGVAAVTTAASAAASTATSQYSQELASATSEKSADIAAERQDFVEKRKAQLELWRATHSAAAFRQ